MRVKCELQSSKANTYILRRLVPVYAQTTTIIYPYQTNYEGIVMIVIECSQVEETAANSENDDGSGWQRVAC